jgi:hypothetical protein
MEGHAPENDSSAQEVRHDDQSATNRLVPPAHGELYQPVRETKDREEK